jgi:hypothetical protein
MTRDELRVELERISIERAAADSISHRLLGMLEHVILYITDYNDGSLPVDPQPEEVKEPN